MKHFLLLLSFWSSFALATSGSLDIGTGVISPGNFGTNGQFLKTDGSSTTSWATPPNFTSTTPGYVPLSGGGTSNFLRADGTWAAAGASGANTTLSNLTNPTAINMNLIPGASLSLGVGATPWTQVFTNNLAYSNNQPAIDVANQKVWGSGGNTIAIWANNIWELPYGGLLLNDTGSHNVTISAPATIGTNWTFKFPTGPGTNHYVLETDGSGNTGWVAGGGAPSGTNNTFSYFDGAGALTSNVDAGFDDTNNSMFFGSSNTGGGAGAFTSTGIGSLAIGVASASSTMTASGTGSFAHGQTNNTANGMSASGVGAMAFGKAISGTTFIHAGADGSIAGGVVDQSNAAITTAGAGAALAMGVVASGTSGTFNADGMGAIVMGSSTIGGALNTSGDGAALFGWARAANMNSDAAGCLVHGKANGSNMSCTGLGGYVGGSTAFDGDLNASGIAGFSHGAAHINTANYGTSFGFGNANSSFESFAVGRFADDVGTDASWVATDPLFVVGNGTSLGAVHNAFKVQKDGVVSMPNYGAGICHFDSNGVISSGANMKEITTLSGTDITHQYVCLTQIALSDSIDFLVRGGGVQIEGASYDYSVSYTDGSCGGKTKITFLNNIATGGPSALIAGDKVVAKYQY